MPRGSFWRPTGRSWSPWCCTAGTAGTPRMSTLIWIYPSGALCPAGSFPALPTIPSPRRFTCHEKTLLSCLPLLLCLALVLTGCQGELPSGLPKRPAPPRFPWRSFPPTRGSPMWSWTATSRSSLWRTLPGNPLRRTAPWIPWAAAAWPTPASARI